MDGVELVGVGRTADVFVLDDERVLRRYRSGRDATGEAELMRYLYAWGYPVPEVFDVDGPDLVLERLSGGTMVQGLAAGVMSIDDAAVVLAQLHERLHSLGPREATDPGSAILHMDLHPENILLTPRGPILIDWSNAIEGPAELDVAMTAVILAQVAVDDASPLAAPATELLRQFLARSGLRPGAGLQAAVTRRAADEALTEREIALLPKAESRIRSTVD